MISTTVKRCSFCKKSVAEVKHLIEGHEGNICDTCVYQCEETLNLDLNINKSDQKSFLNFDLEAIKPQNIHHFLDEYIVGQDITKKKLSVAVYSHYKRCFSSSTDIELTKNNILMIGPTGTGKTLFAETLAKHLDVPFIIVDATTFSQVGYVGDDVQSIIRKLLKQSDNNIAKAQHGIVYIDEVDKLAKKNSDASGGRDISGEGVQQSLLKLMEGSIVSVEVESGQVGRNNQQATIDTKNILFICGGAFTGLSDIIKARSRGCSIGFSATLDQVRSKEMDNDLNDVTQYDLIKYGLIPEFLGRLPIITVLNEMTIELLKQILTEPKNALIKQFRKLFELDGVELFFEDEAISYVAEKSIALKIGARGLRSILNDHLLDLMYQIPHDNKIKRIVITKTKELQSPDLTYRIYYDTADISNEKVINY